MQTHVIIISKRQQQQQPFERKGLIPFVNVAAVVVAET